MLLHESLKFSYYYRLLFRENGAAGNLHEFIFFRQYNPDVGKIKIQIT